MSSYVSSILIAAFGIMGLAALQFGVKPDSTRIAMLVPPWQGDGLLRAAATGLAIVDFHWGRRIIVLDTGSDPDALTRLQEMNLWLLDATGALLCRPDNERI
jgi:hypothetical protein